MLCPLNPVKIKCRTISQRFILALNESLAMENSSIQRLQKRINEAILPDTKQQLQHHLQESQEHQKRLQELITNMGGQPTKENIAPPLPDYPQDIIQMMDNTMTKETWELKRSEDLIIENAEAICYNILIQKAENAEGKFESIIDPLLLNIRDEEHVINWIKITSPAVLDELWPKIEELAAKTTTTTTTTSNT